MSKNINCAQLKAFDKRGFTLVELLTTLVITSFIIAAIYTAYRVNQKHYRNQTEVIEMQQNIRAAMFIMLRELRMAGYDPTASNIPGFVTATGGRLRFTQDIDDNGGTGVGDGDVTDTREDITFGFSATDDADLNGVVDSGAASLGISFDGGTNFTPIADNIAAIEFLYTLEDNAGTITQTETPAAGNYHMIRSVTISILARAENRDTEFTNSATYTTGAGDTWGPAGDNFRRRLLVANVNCRNMGLL